MKKFIFYTKGIDFKSYEENGKKRFFVKGHIDSSDLDLVNDIVTKNCMDDIENQLKSRNIKLDFDHETLRKSKDESDLDAQLNLAKIPLGKAISHNLDTKGNLVEFELNPNWKKFDSKGNVVMTFSEVWDNIKNGFYDAFSIAYVPVKSISKMIGDTKARLLDQINLINVALTGNPINPSATISNVFAKSLEYISEYQEIKSELVEIKNLIGGIKMDKKSEEQTETPEVIEETQPQEELEQPTEEAPKEEAKEEAPAETPAEPEEKSEKEFVEVKSFVELKSKIETMEKSIEKIDNLLSKANQKSKGAEDKSEVKNTIESKNTLDLI